ncbi:hypothetical protein [Erythrobacter sp. F6033]|uniref:hypothetical protein n=1 Tax=Erythrobacter sp. F6033 TaxID=2926401 RepID=UPI001FF3BEA2|nr:hypothetical protein [Erythrobacter sp. F6033]MCK0127584.1 hypothetical protein [Erythrobacter sp. F6033]
MTEVAERDENPIFFEDQERWPALNTLPVAMVSSIAVAAPPNYTKQIQLFDDWNNWICAGGGFVQVLDAVLDHVLKGKATALNAIDAACHAFYNSALDMNTALLAGIKDMQNGKAPSVTFTPSKLPPWPAKKKPDLFSSAWLAIRPVLMAVEKKLMAKDPTSPIVVALGGVIANGDNIVTVLQKYYPSWG